MYVLEQYNTTDMLVSMFVYCLYTEITMTCAAKIFKSPTSKKSNQVVCPLKMYYIGSRRLQLLTS